MKMHLVNFIALALLGVSSLGAAARLPGIDGEFTRHTVAYRDSENVDVYVRDSYRSGAETLSKRFYQTYHNDSQRFEICAETNFVDTYATDGALGADCEAIMAGLDASPGFFETGGYAGSQYNYLAVSGTCAFGVYRLDGSDSEVSIGSKDVVDNLNSALIRFQRQGHVGAEGNFTCSDSVPISWAILKPT
ncbi:putative necrosis-inducing factor-domain-containing protein [Hypoxylon sp. FL1284]|nr:putative necrosis-inducing factor-domain-containing protein [Hypoxylon sp. FL1284]